MSTPWDAVVVGAGPNGLTAAAVLARAGRRVLVLERNAVPGGASTTSALTLPGFVHDDCAAVHPLGVQSPAFLSLQLQRHGLRWCHPPLPLAHPFDDGTAAELHVSVDDTAATLGPDGPTYRRMVRPVLTRWSEILDGSLSPLLPVPRHPLAMARWGSLGIPPVTVTARRFRGHAAPALLAGLAAHSCIRLDRPFTTGMGLLLGVAGHAGGWPVAEGGSRSVVDALVRCVEDHGGEVRCGVHVRSLGELPTARVRLLDVTPRQLLALTDRPVARRVRTWRYGAGVVKADYALDGPVPWTAPAARRAGTVHLGGTFAEVARSERQATSGHEPDRPYVLVAQPTLADPSRAPAGHHVLWAYSHVPNGSTAPGAVPRMEAQLDRFAPGWRDRVLHATYRTPAAGEHRNPNEVGGDIAGGALDGTQLVWRAPYRTGVEGTYLCSSSTAPGAGVHGMCGWHAAHRALARELA